MINISSMIINTIVSIEVAVILFFGLLYIMQRV